MISELLKLEWRDKQSIISQIDQYKNEFFVAISMRHDEWQKWNDDNEIFDALLKYSGVHLCFASHRIQNNKELVSSIIKDKHGFFEYASEELQDDEDVVLLALKFDDDQQSIGRNLSDRLEELLEGLTPLEAISLLENRIAKRELKEQLSVELKINHQEKGLAKI